MSIYAKQVGFQVIAGDISLRSEIVGKALIENKDQKIPPIQYLLTSKDYPRFIKENYGDYFFDTISDLLDNMRATIKKRGDRYPELFLYLKILSYFMAFGMLIRKIPKKPEGYKDRAEQEAAWLKKLADHQVFGRSIKEINNPFPLIRRMIRTINESIFSNGQDNKFIKGNALDLIKKYSDKAEVLYMDPPYPGTLSYDESSWLDKSVMQDINFKEEFGDEWSKKERFLSTYEEYLKASIKIPNFIMSIGNWDTNQLLEILQKYRPKAQLFSIKHNWLRSLKKKERGDEIVLIDLAKWYNGPRQSD